MSAADQAVVQVVPLLGVRSIGSRTFDYLVPAEAGSVERGRIVRVQLNRRSVPAVIVAEGESGEVERSRLREAEHVLPFWIPEHLLELADAAARFYVSPLGSCLQLVAPPASALRGKPTQARRVAHVRPVQGEAPPTLTDAQRRAYVEVPPGGAAVAAVCRTAEVSRPVVDALVRKGALVRYEAEDAEPEAAGSILDDVVPADGQVASTIEPMILTAEQQEALEALRSDLAANEPRRRVLWGVTGSGKTELYLELAAEALERGTGVLVLVPEIALSVQILRRFRRRFGDQVAVLHSGLSPGVRLREYERIAGGEARIVVGARSAVFAPLPDVGLAVLDEAHDSSFKQADEPRYDARTVAWWRVWRSDGLLVEGSATPRAESLVWRRRPVHLKERPAGARLPDIELIDMRSRGGDGMLAPASRSLLEETLRRDEQAVVLLNRRGYSGFLRCPECGEVLMCPHCEVSLTYHRGEDALLCHYCGHRTSVPGLCPGCRAGALVRGVPGTEKLEEELSDLLPGDRVFRLDSDIATSGTRIGSVLAAFAEARPGILVGTQMVAKGHDFPHVTLVVVADADTGLYVPDFRASERTFQLITQVVGRSGRTAKGGRSVVQTWNPEVPCIRMALARDEEGFLKEELEFRRRLGYPPFRRLIRVVVSSKNEVRSTQAVSSLAGGFDRPGGEGQVWGPARLPARGGRYRYQLVLAGAKDAGLRTHVGDVIGRLRPGLARRGVDVIVDVDPQWFD